MATKRGNPSTDAIRQVSEWCREIERDHSCAVRMVLRPTARLGVVRVRVEACDISGAVLVAVRTKVEIDYPNGDAQGLEATFVGLLHKLDWELSLDPLTGALKQSPD